MIKHSETCNRFNNGILEPADGTQQCICSMEQELSSADGVIRISAPAPTMVKPGRPFGYIYRSSDEHWASQALSAISELKQEMFQAMQREELQYPVEKRKSDIDIWNRVNAAFNRAMRSL